MEGKVESWSIDPNVESYFVTNSITHGVLRNVVIPEHVIRYTVLGLAADIANRMLSEKVNNYTVTLLPPEVNNIGQITHYTIVATPNEVKRMNEYIDELESELARQRRLNTRLALNKQI